MKKLNGSELFAAIFFNSSYFVCLNNFFAVRKQFFNKRNTSN